MITVYSVFTSILIFSLSVFLINNLIKKNKFILTYSVNAILIMYLLVIIRLFTFYEFRFTKVLGVTKIITNIFDVLRYEVFYAFSRGITVLDILILVWGAGIVLSLLREYMAWRSLKAYLKNITKIDDERLENKFLSIKSSLDIKENIELIKNSNIKEPLSIDMFRFKKIFIPEYKYSDIEIKSILLHELYHFKSKDGLKKLLFILIKSTMWWNPLVYRLEKNFFQALEINCDIKATQDFSVNEKISYLETINNIIKKSFEEEQFINNKTLALNMYNNESVINLKQRFDLVLDYEKNRFSYKSVVLYLSIFLLFVGSYFVVIVPAYYPEEEGIFSDDSLSPHDYILVDEENGTYELYLDHQLKKVYKSEDKIDEEYKNFEKIIITN